MTVQSATRLPQRRALLDPATLRGIGSDVDATIAWWDRNGVDYRDAWWALEQRAVCAGGWPQVRRHMIEVAVQWQRA